MQGQEELRAIQAPLKERYRQDPDAAIVTLRREKRRADRLRVVMELPPWGWV
jgi:hypothetical protein